ncbi:MAG: replicative DNA helicase [Candidatus Omnitrophica bacterium]|nr:replicative DNA helicase [Candidatus Omnitrophota bacterium]
MADTAVSRSLPFSPEAERSVLAAMLHDRRAMIAGLEVLREQDETTKREALESRGKGERDPSRTTTLFFHTPYQLIFDLIIDLEQRGKSPDFTTLLDEARSKGTLEKIGGPSAIFDIVSGAATGSNVREYAEIVKEKSLKRRLILSTNEILEKAYEDRDNAETILDRAERDLHSISDSRQSGSFTRISDMLHQVQDALNEAYKKKGLVTGVATHFPQLDEMTSGLQKTDLIILAARPSIGKTAFALSLVERIASVSKLPVGVFSLEMSAVQVIQRLICSMAKVDLKRLRSGCMSTRESTKVFNTLGRMFPLPIYIDDSPGLSISSVRARALRLKHKEPDLALLVVDYLQLMEAGTHRGSGRNRQEEVSDISRGLKGLARELGVPVLAISQLSRGVESREDNMPRLSDLRESGAIEQDADVVMFIHRKRPARDSEEDEENVAAEIIIGKQRNGPVGNVPVAFISRYASFQPFSSEDAPPGHYQAADDEGVYDGDYGAEEVTPF